MALPLHEPGMPHSQDAVLAHHPDLVYFALAVGQLWSITLSVFAIGLGRALGLILQTWLMDVAGRAQTLAAALNHLSCPHN